MHSEKNNLDLKQLEQSLSCNDPALLEQALGELEKHRHSGLVLSESVKNRLRQLYIFHYHDDIDDEIEIRRKALITSCVYYQDRSAVSDVIKVIRSVDDEYLLQTAIDCLTTIGRYPENNLNCARELANIVISPNFCENIKNQAYCNLLEITNKISVAAAARAFVHNQKFQFDFEWLKSLLSS